MTGGFRPAPLGNFGQKKMSARSNPSIAEATFVQSTRKQRFLKTSKSLSWWYCKTHYYRAPFNFTHFALDDDNAFITGANIHSK